MDKGLTLKIARLEAGLRQYEVAKALGVSPQFLSQLELSQKPFPGGFEDRYLAAVAEHRRRPVSASDRSSSAQDSADEAHHGR